MLYTLSSIGMSVTTHYCAGKAMTCKCAKPKDSTKKDHCCKDTVKYLKSQEVHQFQQVEDLKKYHTTSVAIPFYFHAIVIKKGCYKSTISYFTKGGTELNGPPLYELFCNYKV